jgi:hypothetical protein
VAEGPGLWGHEATVRKTTIRHIASQPFTARHLTSHPYLLPLTDSPNRPPTSLILQGFLQEDDMNPLGAKTVYLGVNGGQVINIGFRYSASVRSEVSLELSIKLKFRGVF